MVMAHPFLTLFTPHLHNNHKAKILWPQSVFILLLIFLVGQFSLNHFTKTHPGVLGFASQIDPMKIIEMTNSERVHDGLGKLTYNQELSNAALAKAQDMFSEDYWAHVSPTGVEPWSFITKAGYEYQHAGENLARDFANPKDVVAAWMASPTHRQNILDGRYQDIGVAVMDGYLNGVETTLVVQMFGTTSSSIPAVASSQISAPLPTQTFDQAQPSVLNTNIGLTTFSISRSWSLAFLIVITFSLAFDWLFVWKNNLIRISGDSWAHLSFFIALGVIALIIRQGIII